MIDFAENDSQNDGLDSFAYENTSTKQHTRIKEKYEDNRSTSLENSDSNGVLSAEEMT